MPTTPVLSVIGSILAELTSPVTDPVNDPVIPLVTFNDPDITELPTIVCEPVTYNDPVTSNPFGNATNPLKNDAVPAVVANEDDVAVAAVVAYEALTAVAAVVAYDAVAGTKVMLVAALAVVAKEDEVALTAQLDVPKNATALKIELLNTDPVT